MYNRQFKLKQSTKKFDEVKGWLDKGIFDVLFIQESKIDQTYPNEQFRADGYNRHLSHKLKPYDNEPQTVISHLFMVIRCK